MGVSKIKYFQLQSEGSLPEIFLTDEREDLEKVRAARCYGIMTNEMIDASVSSQLQSQT